MDLSKIHSMARVCYDAWDEESKKNTRILFNEMDKNGDGTVSLQEFLVFGCKHFEKVKYRLVTKIFGVLDDDKNGSLDFWEAVTFYYIMQSGHVSCNDCGTLLFDGNYFVCNTCFGTKHSYNLCVDCYGTNSSKHQKHPKCDDPAKFVGAVHLLSLTQAKLDQTNHLLRDTQAKLDHTNHLLRDTQAKLDHTNHLLRDTQAKLDQANLLVCNTQTHLDRQVKYSGFEKIHSMARACYDAWDEERKKTARKLFNEMDKNGDGTVSLQEFLVYGCKHFGKAKYRLVTKIFRVLDDDKSGRLDFWEAVTFYYIMQSGWEWCEGCDALFSDGHYFVCLTCFGQENSYHLCVDCYTTNSFKHKCDGPTNFVSKSYLLSVIQAQLDHQEFNNSRDPKREKRLRRVHKAKIVEFAKECVKKVSTSTTL